MVVLSQDGQQLNHDGQAKTVSVKSMTPYTYNGSLQTSCNVKRDSDVLMLVLDADQMRSIVQIEHVSKSNEPVNRIMYGAFSLMFCCQGNVKVDFGEGLVFVLNAKETLYIERGGELESIQYQLHNESEVDCPFVIIDIHEKPLGSPLTRCVTMPSYRSRSLSLELQTPLLEMLTLTPQTFVETECNNPTRFQPPAFIVNAAVPPPVNIDELAIADFPNGQISTAWINIMKQGLSEWIRIPMIIMKGVIEGPVLGITAAVHGNELNGVPCIHRLVSSVDVNILKGSIVCIPCVNIPGYLNCTREFSDKKDLNRLFPGVEDGQASSVFAYHFMQKIVTQFDYLIDLHTASFGRVNSYYVRADMNDPVTAIMARLQHPQIILHNSGQDGTLRSAAAVRGIKSITVEIGNPQSFQTEYIEWCFNGLLNILHHFEMLPTNDFEVANPIVCSRGFWIYTRTGGVLEVYPDVNSIVKKNEVIACIRNIFGNVIDEYYAPSNGIVIGKSSNPVSMAGDRIVHFGIIKKQTDSLPTVAKENY